MDPQRPYLVTGPALGSAQVEAWSGYPLQFAGQRRFGWQDQMAADLRTALAGLIVHATSRGPRSATTISESLIDGTIAAFHTGTSASAAAAVATALARRMPGMEAADIRALAAMSSPGPLFAPAPFVVRGTYIQINPCDERCYAGQVTIQPDAQGRLPQISGELFTLRRAMP
jgi:hypothetical protein